MGFIKSAIGDAVLTSMWVFSTPLLRVFTGIIAANLGVQGIPLAGLFITINLVTVLILFLRHFATLLGGASYNPSSTVSFYAAGLRPDTSLLSTSIRFPAQAAGAVAGAMAIIQAMPQNYKNTLGGPFLKTDVHTGAIVEGASSFVLNFARFMVMVKGPKSPLLKIWMVAVVTGGLVVNGAKYTGPSLNPAMAFGWAFINNRHNSWELYYVYWISPLIGAVFAGWTYKLLFSKPSTKHRSA